MKTFGVLLLVLGALVCSAPIFAPASSAAEDREVGPVEKQPVAKYIGQGQGLGALFSVGYGDPGTPHDLTPTNVQSHQSETKCSAQGSPRNACSATLGNSKCTTVPNGSTQCSAHPPGSGAGNECSAYGPNSECSADSTVPDAEGTFCSAFAHDDYLTICSADDEEEGAKCSATGGSSQSTKVLACSANSPAAGQEGKGAFCSVNANGGGEHEATCTNVHEPTSGAETAKCSSEEGADPPRCSVFELSYSYETGWTARIVNTGVTVGDRTLCTSD